MSEAPANPAPAAKASNGASPAANSRSAGPPRRPGSPPGPPGQPAKGGIQNSLELAQKYKEEDRFFLGTEAAEREEREKGSLSKMVDLAVYGTLKVTLVQLRSMISQNIVSEDSLDQHIRFYLRKSEDAVNLHLKSIVKMLLEQARVPGQGMGTQVVLMFKAIDCLRMCVQYTQTGVDTVSSFMVLQIMAQMPPAFISHMNREKEIFNLNLELHRTLKDKRPTINVRNKLAILYMQQKCYADALFQHENILRYFLSKKPQTPADREKLCVIHMGIGDMYKSIFTFDGEFKNGQILQNFVFRYNREADILFKERHSITPVVGNINKLTVKKTYKDLQQIAVLHYEAALKYFPADKNRRKHAELLVTVGKNYQDMGKAIDAGERFRDAFMLVNKENACAEIFKQKEDLLQMMRDAIARIPKGNSLGDKLSTFVFRENGKLETDKQEWEEQERRKAEIKANAEQGVKKKLL